MLRSAIKNQLITAILCHSREGGNPELSVKRDSRFRGNDEECVTSDNNLFDSH